VRISKKNCIFARTEKKPKKMKFKIRELVNHNGKFYTISQIFPVSSTYAYMLNNGEIVMENTITSASTNDYVTHTKDLIKENFSDIISTIFKNPIIID
jgi:hypothetical protein